MHAFSSNLANRQTDRQSDKQTPAKHASPPLLEVNNRQQLSMSCNRCYRC